MKRIAVVYLLILMMILIVGCTYNESYHIDENCRVIIKGYYDKPESMDEKSTIIIEGILSGEFIEIVVHGEIYYFEHVSLEWDENKNELVEKEIMNRFNKLTNQTVVIKTYMPEGIPSEKIKWKSDTGKAYEFIISDYSLDGETENVFEFVLE